MAISKDQIKQIHTVAHQVGLNEPQYRLLLNSVAGVDSCKKLTQVQFEDVMAVIEDMGAAMPLAPEIGRSGYWRQRVKDRGHKANARLVFKIYELSRAAGQPINGLCRRMSGDRTIRPEELTPREAFNVIEALKAISARSAAPTLAEASDVKPAAEPLFKATECGDVPTPAA